MKPIPITKPTLEPYSAYESLLCKPIKSGMLTNAGNVQELEEKVADYLGVKYAVAVSSCTAGLMLVLKSLNLQGEVIMPSFTFLASGLPILWNGLTPVFVDIDPNTYCIDPVEVEKKITKRTIAVLATHVFGVPCDIKKLQAVARKHKIKLIFDAAHAFGSTLQGVPVGSFGDAEVFSCSPTKVFTTGEGGIVTTNNHKIADFVRRGRNYGDNGSSSIDVPGLSARMPEMSAAIGLRSLAKLRKNLKSRQSAARDLVSRILKVESGLKFQLIPNNVETTYKDLSVYVDPTLGYTRDELHKHFASRGIMTRKYFYPSLHQMGAYASFAPKVGALSVTEQVTKRVLSLPMYSHISLEERNAVVLALEEFIHDRKKS